MASLARTLFSKPSTATSNIARFASVTTKPRAFATTADSRHKESNVHHNLENPAQAEHHKQDGISKQKAGKGHWKPELASDSEEAVKADRAHDGSNINMKDLQERTKAAAEEKHKSGTSSRDGL